ncbi:MAG: MerR family transcriptional regulator [Myxococcales bacterium]|nr:MerR family transcriptional regulator [Myxococcales bacterium]
MDGAVDSQDEYTIDELAARSGVPSRTIRFYQAKGVLPPPRKRGRVAIYDSSHMERLDVVGQLQDKGLRLRAIRDIVARKDLDSGAIQKWLGVGERLGHLSEDEPKLLTEDELKELLGNPPAGIIARLVRRDAIQVQGEGAARRFLVESPALLGVAMRLMAAGVELDVVLGLHDILERRFHKAADEIVDYAIKHVGKGFGRGDNPDDIMALLETIFSDGAGTDAIRVIFTREVQRSVQKALQLEPDPSGRRAGRRR